MDINLLFHPGKTKEKENIFKYGYSISPIFVKPNCSQILRYSIPELTVTTFWKLLDLASSNAKARKMRNALEVLFQG